MLLDVHTHVDMYKENLINDALDEIREIKILSVSNSMTPKSWERNLELSKETELIIPAFGIHPWKAPDYVDKFEELDEMIQQSLFIGEIGLDYHFIRDLNHYEAQLKVFNFFLERAKKYQKPIIVHTKGAESEILDMIRIFDLERVIIHWYSGPVDVFNEMIKEGWLFTIGFMVCESDISRAIARKTPDSQILTETDNPGGFEWRHKKQGMPRLIEKVIAETAMIRNQGRLEIEQLVWENFMNVLSMSERSEILRKIHGKKDLPKPSDDEEQVSLELSEFEDTDVD